MLHAANLTKYNYGKYQGNQAFGKSIEAKGNAKTPSCTVEFGLSNSHRFAVFISQRE